MPGDLTRFMNDKSFKWEVILIEINPAVASKVKHLPSDALGQKRICFARFETLSDLILIYIYPFKELRIFSFTELVHI